MAWDPGERSKNKHLNVLVIGAGVVGLVYASELEKAGHDVAILGHDAADTAVAQEGVNLFDLGSGTQQEFRPRLVPDAGAAEYDLVLLAVQRQQLMSTHGALRALRGNPLILTLLNLPEGRLGLPEGLPGTISLGIPGIAGRFDRELAEIRYVRLAQQITVLEESDDPAVTALVRQIAQVFGLASFPTMVVKDVPQRLAYIGLQTAVLGRALQAKGIDPAKLARDWNAIGKMCRAFEEGFAVLRTTGYGRGPFKLRTLHTPWLIGLAALVWSSQLRLGTADLTFGVPLRQDEAEVDGLADWVLATAAVSKLATPNLQEQLREESPESD